MSPAGMGTATAGEPSTTTAPFDSTAGPTSVGEDTTLQPADGTEGGGVQDGGHDGPADGGEGAGAVATQPAAGEPEAPDMPASPSADGDVADSASPSDETSVPEAPLTVYIAGDSTVMTYEDIGEPMQIAGWGQLLQPHLREYATVANHAIGGRTARRFIDEGRLDAIWNAIEPGDYLLVQFGTNDGHRTATYTIDGNTIPYYLDPSTDFKDYLRYYIDGARERDATLVLVTPPPRNSAYCTGGNGTGAHAEAMRELALAEDTLLVDLNRRTVDYLQAICPAPSTPDFFLQRADGTVDGTHFQERGAAILARFVAEELDAQGVPFASPTEATD